ncbi:hypothetical protein IMAU60055_02801 [Lactiplantibacillus plantarum]|nr:hypothetical protein [Lactiplantibacillus plantarum]
MFRNSKSRFISFSDSVFSVILTVLVLEIRLPIGRNILSNSWLNFGYSIIIYIARFSLVSTYWFFHQKLFSNVKQIDGNLIVLNFYFLFFISLMPILTQLIALDPLSKVKNFIYAATYLIFNLYLWWLFDIVFRHHVITDKWGKEDSMAFQHELKVIKDTVFVGVLASAFSLLWGPTTPIILSLSPLVRSLISSRQKY